MFSLGCGSGDMSVYIVLKTQTEHLTECSLSHVNSTSMKLKEQNRNRDTTTPPSEWLKLKGLAKQVMAALPTSEAV